jgi:leucyl aminopeptidase (aminopeptidase T)
MNEALERAVSVIACDCLAVEEGEDVLVIADTGTRELAEALREGVAAAGGDPVLALMDPRATDGTEPPPTIAAAWEKASAFLAPTSYSLSHTNARNAASAAGCRGATLPGATVDLVARMLDGDFGAMRARSRAVAAVLDTGTTARITCPLGTDLTLDLTGRAAISDDGDLSAPGAFGNLPCGEGFVAPLSGEGRMMASSLARVGLAETPAELVLAGGRLQSAGGAAGEQLLAMLDGAGSDGRNLAELGIGTNDRAGLTGNILEDEKILGTAHIAFGASIAIGGTVSVPIHLDCVILDASVEVDGTPVLDAGKLVLDVA